MKQTCILCGTKSDNFGEPGWHAVGLIRRAGQFEIDGPICQKHNKKLVEWSQERRKFGVDDREDD